MAEVWVGGSTGGFIGGAVCAGGVEGEEGAAGLSESTVLVDVLRRLWKKLVRCLSMSFVPACLIEPAIQKTSCSAEENYILTVILFIIIMIIMMMMIIITTIIMIIYRRCS